jgi:hypothetical protein
MLPSGTALSLYVRGPSLIPVTAIIIKRIRTLYAI